MKTQMALAAAAVGMMFAASASANPNIYYGDPVVDIDTDISITTGPIYNQATLKSGGKASANNKSNFQDVTTTTTTTTTQPAFNKNNDNPVPGQDKVDIDVSVETETSKSKVH